MSLAEKIALKIGSNTRLLLNVDEDQEQIIIYGAINLFQMLCAILWVIIAGLLFGVLYEALIFSIVVSTLRKYSGGVHASSPSRCVIIGTVIAAGIGIFIDKLFYKVSITNLLFICIIFTLFSLIVVVRNAPIDSIKKPITNIEMRKELKKKSIIVILILLALIVVLCALYEKHLQAYYIKIVESIILGILWQSFTLTKSGMRIMNKIDFVLKYIMKESD